MENNKQKKGISLYVMFWALLLYMEVNIVVALGYSWFQVRKATTLTSAAEKAAFVKDFNLWVGGLIVVIILILSLICGTILKKIRKGFGLATEVTNALAVGDTDVEINNNPRWGKEFNALFEDYKKLKESSKQQAEVAQAVANGDLTVDVEVRSDKDTLGIALKNLVDTNNHALSNVNSSAYQVMTSAAQVAAASEALAQGSTEQASAIEQTTSSIAEIAEKTKENANRANEAASLVAEAINSVDRGNQEMTELMAAMAEINESSENISQIIKVIDDIAFQTNILALNAAVEAARAGDAGKGFAVVAEEVRNLAAKSSEAAAETASLIEDSIAKVEAGSKIADSSREGLTAITDAVNRTEGLVNEIAESSNYQATAVAQINQAINQVSQVVSNNSATSEECAAASVDLSNQASHMDEMLSIYNLGDNLSLENSTVDVNEEANDVSNETIISLGEDFGKY